MEKFLLSDLKDVVIREGELKKLLSIYDEVGKEGYRCVLIEGSMGSGKTALVENFASRVDCHYLKVYGLSYNIPEPYLPFRMLLESVERESGTEKLFIGGHEEVGGIADRMRKLLSLLSKDKVVVLFVDDAHYLDDGSITLLMYLRYALEKNRIMVICAYRPEEGGSLRGILARLLSDPRTEHMVLRKLSYDRVKKILIDDLGYNFSEDVVKVIYEASGGNPYFLNELLNILLSSGAIDKSRKVWNPDVSLKEIKLPRTVAEMIAGRFNALSEKTRKFLSYAAIFGKSFDFDDVAEVSGLGEDALDALEEAINAGFVTETPLGYEFTNLQVVRSIYDTIMTERRKRMHLKVARYLEEKGASVYDLATHYYHARDIEKAKKYLTEAMRKAQGAGAYRESLWFIKSLKSLGVENDEIRFREGLAYCTLGNYGKGLDILLSIPKESPFYEDAVITSALILEGKGERSLAANMLIELFERTEHKVKVGSRLVVTLSRLGNIEGAKKVLACMNIDDGSPIDHYFLEKAHAVFNYYAGIGDEALKHFIKALEYIEKVEDFEVEKVRAYSNLGAMYGIMGDADRSEEYFKKSLELAEKIGYVEGIMYVYMNWSESLRYMGRYEDALKMLNKCMEMAKIFGHLDVYAGSKLNFAWIYLEKGKYEDALHATSEIIRMVNDAYVYSESWFVMGYAAMCLNDKGWAKYLRNAVKSQPQKIRKMFWNELLKFELNGNKSDVEEYYRKLPSFEKVFYSPFIARVYVKEGSKEKIKDVIKILERYSQYPRVKIIKEALEKLISEDYEGFRNLMLESHLPFYLDIMRYKGTCSEHP